MNMQKSIFPLTVSGPTRPTEAQAYKDLKLFAKESGAVLSDEAARAVAELIATQPYMACDGFKMTIREEGPRQG
jgi:hypothetical protein